MKAAVENRRSSYRDSRFMDRSVVGALSDTFWYMKSGLGRPVTSKILWKRGRV